MARMELEKIINLHGYVSIEDKDVVSLSANVSSKADNATNYSEAVTNPEMYYSNRGEVREQIDMFRLAVREAEDELVVVVNEEEEETEEED